jgi:subtilisin family serine protease
MIGVQLLLAGVLTGPGLAQTTGKHPKMGSAIVDASQERYSEAFSNRQAAWARPMSITREGLHVYIHVVEVSGATLASLEALGATIELADPEQRLVQARVPLPQLQAVANLASVTYVRLPDYGIQNRQGSVGTQGDGVIRAHLRRGQFGATGEGVRVGVVSDGVSGLTSGIDLANLPVSGITMPAAPLTGGGISLDSPLPGGTVFTTTPMGRPDLTTGSEGRALLEIIHDVAPGAQLYFAPHGGTTLSYPRAVRWLLSQGVKVIADDILVVNAGPYDGTSAVSQEAAAAVANGASYFISVGNFGEQHYRGMFTDTDGDGLHEFDVSLGLPRVNHAGETLNITVPPGSTAQIFLQWDDPPGGSGNDYDLCFHDPADLPVSPLFCSTDPQTGTQDPTEFLTIINNGPIPGVAGIRIDRPGMAAPRTFDLFVNFSSGGSLNEFVVPEGSVPNKADAGGGVVSVGAFDWLLPDLIEPFSSRGPTRDGRLKPEIIAPDGVSTGVPGFAPFFGTSAAAPHAAGAAALLLGQNPSMTPAQIAGTLQNTAVDLGPLGADNIFGFGRIDAFPTAPRARLTTDRGLYRTGDTLRLSASLEPGSALNTGDAYVFAAVPDGSTIVSLVPTPGGTFMGAIDLQPLALGFPIPPFSGEFFQFTFTGTEPGGLYLIVGTHNFPGQTPLPLNADHLEQTIIFDATFFEFLP